MKHMRHENPETILTEEIDEEILERMPEWFRILRKAYEEKSRL